MNLLAVIGSPRKGKSTDTLVDKAIEGVISKSPECKVKKIHLIEHNIEFCKNCLACRDSKTNDPVARCSIRDDMDHINQDILNSDLLIFGTPLYWYGPTAKMKLLIDRMRPFVANGHLKGKNAVVVVPSAEGAGAWEPLIEMFRLSFEYLGMSFEGKILVEAYEKEAVLENQSNLDSAYELGAFLKADRSRANNVHSGFWAKMVGLVTLTS